jgi:hypothetical protein
MIEEIKTAYRFLIVMGVGGILFLFSVLVPVLSSDADFSIYNSSWNGCSTLGREAYQTGSFLPTIDISSSSEEKVVHSSFADLSDQLDPTDSAIMIIGPELDFDIDEGRFVHDFLNEGGMVLLADDVGSGNQLLGYLNTSTRVSGEIMIDLSFMKKAEFAVTNDLVPHNITEGVETLLMNYPSTISHSKETRPLINSSGASWQDRTRNGRRDVGEPLGPFSILTVEKYGKGQLIVLSEPSFLINNMRNQMDNSQLVSNLIDYISRERDTLVIDESHRDLTNPVQVANIFVGRLNLGEKVGILIGLSVFFLIISTPYPKLIWKRLESLLNKLLTEEEQSGPGPSEVIDEVLGRHPDWDRNQLERYIQEIGGNQ